MPTTGPAVAEHVGAHAGHHADDRAEQHADRRIAQEAEADTQVGRQLDRQTEQIQRDVDRNEQRRDRQTAGGPQLTQRADKDIRSFRHRKRHLLIKFICCHSDLGKCLNSCSSGMRPQYRKEKAPFRPPNNSPFQRHLTHCALLCFFCYNCTTVWAGVNTENPWSVGLVLVHSAELGEMADNLLDKGIGQPPPCSGGFSEKYRKRASNLCLKLFFLVRMGGLEPPRPCEH